MLNVSPEKICYIIVKAREFDAKVEPVEPDPGSNPADGGEREILSDYRDPGSNRGGFQLVRCPLWVTSRLHGHCVDTSALRAEADVIGGKADVEHERLLSARERKSPSRGSNFRS